MKELSFQELPQKYFSMLNQISDGKLKSIYSMFSFKYLFYTSALDESNETQIKNLLFDYLKKFKFIVYSIFKINSYLSQIDHSSYLIPSKIDIIFCVEGQCIIIEKIDLAIIKRIISNLKENKSSLINTNTIQIDEEDFKIEKGAEEEIKNFCHFFKAKIKNNLFLSQTIHPIAGYLIRRFFYPSDYFSDRTFFYFDDAEKIEDQKLKKEFMSFLHSRQLSQTEDDVPIKNEIQNKRKLINFEPKDFIILRTIFSNDKALYCLAIHIKSLHIFVMKIFSDFGNFKKEKCHEMYFCQNFSHRCLTRCYGFIKDKNKTKGIIYKFMSNGSLNSYVLSNRDKIDETFSILTISRIIQGLDYLYTNKLIHRDLKPTNILLDHDFLPYISDFDSIRHPNEGEESDSSNEMTNDVGSMYYMSPEQYRGENISYATDIYSFGLIIYFLYEKQNLYSLYGVGNYIKNEDAIPKLIQASDIIQTLFSKSIKFDAKERITIQDIKCISFSKFSLILYKNLNKTTIIPKSLQLIFELFIIFINFSQREYELCIITGSLYEEKQNYKKTKDYEDGYGVEQDYNQAKEYYELSAQLNNSNAFYYLGLLYANGQGVKQDYNQAKEYYELSAQLNNSDALNNLGNLYADGQGVKQDYNQAKEYYELSAQLNNSDALNNLGNLYADGQGVKQDYNQAKEYYELSAQQNNSYALNNLGNLYANGQGVKQDYNQAKEYFELSAKQNNSYALNNLGNLYGNGYGVKRDYNKAKEYFELSIKSNNKLAYLNMGNVYRKVKDYSLSIKYYKLAAQCNYSEALCKIGTFYLKGLGVEKNYLKAKDFYEQSADKNNSNALIKLGNLYYNGQGVKQDYKKAKEYYELSGRQGNSKALFEIGNFYFEGQGVEQNYDKAKYYYEMSSYNNNPDGLFFLGVFYSRGDILEVNIPLAVQYFLKSIEIHFGQARVDDNVDHSYIIKNIYNKYYYHSHNDLGLIYLTIYEDIENATKYIKEAAFGEYPFGQNNFGLLNEIYLNELGNAEYMYQRSSKHNFALAFYNLGHLKEKETQEKTEERKGKENQDSEEYIEYYKKASDSEDCPLIFHNRQYYDKRLEISKTFIICMTNLKLFEYYFDKGDLTESKKYFTKSLSKLLNDKEHLTIKTKIDDENPEFFFSYLKNFILSFPSFNLDNQPFLNKAQSIEYNFKLKQNQDVSSLTHEKSQEENIKEQNLNEIEKIDLVINNDMIKKIKERKYFANKGIKEEIDIELENNKEEETQECENEITKSREEEKTFKDGNEIFEFIVSNEKYKNIFEEEIKKIIQVMNDIIYTPPYPILFGRINISKKNQEEEINPYKKEINELFYEGLGLEEFKYNRSQ